jgi:apolipoprotein N-acyltransferase
MKKTLLTITTIVSSCFFVLAQSSLTTTSAVTFSPVVSLITQIQRVLDRVLPLLVSLSVIGFFWFMLRFVWVGVDNPEERKKARTGVMWSLLTIFVMVSLWGIITFIASTLGVGVGGEMLEFRLPGT